LAAISSLQPLVLEGTVVRLEPLRKEHTAALTDVGIDEDIWRHMPYGKILGEADMRHWVESVLARAAEGMDLPFAVVHLPSGRIAGATRYMEIRQEHRGLEIGGTWYGAEFRRTAVNTECKFLLLQHAFDVLGCVRVQFKTDARNERSQRALERIGARKEGTLRNHMILPGGIIRHSVYYSILDLEWPGVQRLLRQKLELRNG
jgi:RimJ/RimL family protein N-acetyltransferase